MSDIVVHQGSVVVKVGTANNTKVGVKPSGTVAGQTGTPIREVARVDARVAVKVKTNEATATGVEVGIPGPAGPAGPSGGSSVLRLAAQSLGGHRMVRSISAVEVDYASNDDPAHGDDTLGITNGAVTAGEAVDVVITGPITFNGWAWTPLQPVFLGTNGLLTQTAPAVGFVQEVGYAESPTTLFVRIEPPYYIED